MRKKDKKLAAVRRVEARLKAASPVEAGRLTKVLIELKDQLLGGE